MTVTKCNNILTTLSKNEKINDQTFKSKHLDLARSGQQNMQIKSSNILEIATLEGGEH